MLSWVWLVRLQQPPTDVSVARSITLLHSASMSIIYRKWTMHADWRLAWLPDSWWDHYEWVSLFAQLSVTCSAVKWQSLASLPGPYIPAPIFQTGLGTRLDRAVVQSCKVTVFQQTDSSCDTIVYKCTILTAAMQRYYPALYPSYKGTPSVLPQRFKAVYELQRFISFECSESRSQRSTLR